MNTVVDGEFQRYAVEDGAYIREHFFGPDPRLRKLVEHLSDDELENLPRGGHDYQKLYAAYKAAVEETDRPTVILAKTIKGWTLGQGFEARNSTHQLKKMNKDQLLEMRERLHLQDEIPEADLEDGIPPYFKPAPDSVEMQYLLQRRTQLGGPLPKRVVRTRRPLTLPEESIFDDLDKGSGGREVSTTMVFTATLRSMMRDQQFGERVVPIIPDEARTFGMDSMFREFEIYAPHGQLYEPVDHELLLSYSEDTDGQILEEGITEAGGMASWIAAATAYSNYGVPMVPFFTFYSMFGFQRVGDLIWSAADSRARGFLMGATAGRTTLEGEGLQHQDGHSLILASTVPACEAYDPAYAYELGALIKDGLRRMYGPESNGGGEDIFYYLTIYNENYEMPTRPDHVSDEDIVSGLYQWADAPERTHKAAILFSGSAQGAAREAQAELAEHFDVGAELWSATSYKKLRENALSVERSNRTRTDGPPTLPDVTVKLANVGGPIVAVTDFMKMVPDQIARWVPGRFVPLGTDGFGRSDTREALRSFFEIDTPNVVVATLAALADEGRIDRSVVGEALTRYNLDPNAQDPAQAH